MSNLLTELHGHVYHIILNCINKHNAFDDVFLGELQQVLDAAIANKEVRVIVFRANGKHFSAGADLAWMQRMIDFSEEENLRDAEVLARFMLSLYECKKPTIAMVHGAAIGGGVGIVAACDIAIAAESASFCFAEVKIGLIPATISPYVIKALGARVALGLFMSAESFSAQRALEINLVQHCVPDNTLLSFTNNYAERMARLAPEAVRDAKKLVRDICDFPISETLQHITAECIAKKRVTIEAQLGLRAFLEHKTPPWDDA